jgi:hypothetical protein
VLSVAIAVGGIALGGVLELDSQQGRLPASDIELAQNRMILKERLALAMEGGAQVQAHDVPVGVKAAEDASLDSTERG